MNISALARSLGISRQMVYKLRDKGMPTNSPESTLAWRKTNIDSFRSKAVRIDGNTGVKYQSPNVNKSESDNQGSIRRADGIGRRLGWKPGIAKP